MSSLARVQAQFTLDLVLDRMKHLQAEVHGLKSEVAALKAVQDEILQRLADGGQA